MTCILVILGVANDDHALLVNSHGSSFTGKIETVLRARPPLDLEPRSFGRLLQFTNAVLDFLERNGLVLRVNDKDTTV